jgi:hypothetical protein
MGVGCMYNIEYMVVVAIFIVVMGFIYNTFFNGGDWDE